MKSICSTLFFTFMVLGAVAQYPDDIHLNELRVWLKENTYDGEHNDLGYNQARIQMYSYVDEVDGKISCVYTGFQQDAESTTFLNPINAEHVVPQSFYNSASPMRSDIHNLRPSHSSANSERGNLGFGEVPDANATWYGVNSVNEYSSTNNEPAENEGWSERFGGDWEPREDRKGDIARQVFYFYTMYPTVGGSIQGLAEVEQLYEWHLADPVSAEELERNDRAEEVQGNRNPYVDYEELVFDAWLWEETESVSEDVASIPALSVYPNPAVYSVTIEGLSLSSASEITLTDGIGRILDRIRPTGLVQELDISNLESGNYVLVVKDEFGAKFARVVKI